MLLPLLLQSFVERTPAPLPGSAPAKPEIHLHQGIGECTSIPIDVHEARIGKNRMQEPEARPAGDLGQQARAMRCHQTLGCLAETRYCVRSCVLRAQIPARPREAPEIPVPEFVTLG